MCSRAFGAVTGAATVPPRYLRRNKLVITASIFVPSRMRPRSSTLHQNPPRANRDQPREDRRYLHILDLRFACFFEVRPIQKKNFDSDNRVVREREAHRPPPYRMGVTKKKRWEEQWRGTSPSP